MGATRQAGTERTNQTTRGSHRVLNVTHLSLEQRVLVQLGGVGLFDATCQQVRFFRSLGQRCTSRWVWGGGGACVFFSANIRISVFGKPRGKS